jgi:hypothetical protein
VLLVGLVRIVQIDPSTRRGVWSVPPPGLVRNLLYYCCHSHSIPVTPVAIHIIVFMNWNELNPTTNCNIYFKSLYVTLATLDGVK